MWTYIKSFFRNFFTSEKSPSSPLGDFHRAREIPEDAFRYHDEEYYTDAVQAPNTYEVDRRLIQEKFLEIIKYYNDVIMTNTMVFSEEELLEYQKKIFEIEKERKKFIIKSDITTHLNIEEDFMKYILKKVESIQGTLGTYNKQLSFFYNKYRVTYDSVSIIIIVLSSSLSMIEGITLCFSDSNTISTIISLVVSTTIAVLTSILKFKNIKEKIEEVVKMREKIYNCQAKLYTFDKELKTTIFLSANNNKGQNECSPTDHTCTFV